MKTLRDRSGATRATVAHYLKLGLLPRPVRTGRNMAWYDPVCVELMEAIGELREKSRVSLAEIADMVVEHGFDHLKALLAATRRSQRNVVEALRASAPETRQAALGRKGISKSVLDELERLDLVTLTDGSYDPDSVAVIDAVDALRTAGLDEQTGFAVSDLEAYRQAVGGLAEAEMELFNRRVLGHGPADRTEQVLGPAFDSMENFILALRRRLLFGLVEGQTD